MLTLLHIKVVVSVNVKYLLDVKSKILNLCLSKHELYSNDLIFLYISLFTTLQYRSIPISHCTQRQTWHEIWLYPMLTSTSVCANEYLINEDQHL